MHLSEILSDYDKSETNSDRIDVFRAVSKIHELKSSSHEFERLQKIVKSSESTEYIKDKRYIKSSLDSLNRSRNASKRGIP